MRSLPNSEMIEKVRSAEETRPAIVPQMVQADGRNSQEMIECVMGRYSGGRDYHTAGTVHF